MMKQILLLLAMVAGGLMQPVVAQDSARTAQDTTKQSLQMVATNYLNLKNALTRDDDDSAKLAAGQLHAALDGVSVDSLSSAQREVWAQYGDKLRLEAHKVEDADGIADQREHFKDLSTNIIGLLKGLNIITADLYVQYCPMAKAHWLSEETNIVNPYQGQMMPSCGSTTDTLKAVK